MCKLGGSGLTPKNWRRRWFILKDKKLYYYKTAFVSLLSSLHTPHCTLGYTLTRITYPLSLLPSLPPPSPPLPPFLPHSLMTVLTPLQDVSALGIVDMVGYTIEQSPESKRK